MKEHTKILRSARVWHRKVASVLFIFFFIISITAILLGWKDLFAEKIVIADTKQQKVDKSQAWLPMDSLMKMASESLNSKLVGSNEGKPISMNARLDKGSIRFVFHNNYNVQLNAQTGEIQSIEKKAPEWFIKLHDGEILDDLFHLKNGISKKIYVSIMGSALFFLTISGFWMWFRPLQLKKIKK